MKKRFIAILMAGGLVIGMCGCGSSGSTSTPGPAENAVQEEQEAPVQDDSTQSSNLAESAGDAMSAGRCLDIYSVDELVDMLLSGEITMTDIEYNVATGDLSYEEYEEILSLVSPMEPDRTMLEQSASQTGNASEGGDYVGNIDVSSLLTTHVVEFKDNDGYTIRETCQLSPIFTEDDSEAMYVLWEALGHDIASFPSEESVYNKTYLIRHARDNASCNKLEYIVGTYMVENLTDGFPITPDNPRTYSARLAAKQVSAFDEEHDGNAAQFFNWNYVAVVMYSNNTVYYDEEDAVNPGIMLGVAKMQSDVWEPVHFVIALPNGATPNRPDGYRYDQIQLQFGSLASYYSDSDTFGLTYFEQEESE